MSKPVLLIESNPGDELLALHALKKNGLGEEEVAIARDGAEALEYLFGARAGRDADGLPGLVLLDQRLPAVDGQGMLRRLRTDDRTASLPVVVLASGDLSEMSDDYSAWTFIQKPLTSRKLAEAARKLGVRGLLPGEAASRGEQALTSAPSRVVSLGSKPLRVLLVEGSEDDAALILRALRNGGHEPVHRRVETRAGMEAALAEEEWDVLVSAYHPPAFGALEALEIIRESGLDLPVIVVSGKMGEDVAVEVMRAGANDYIMKANLARLVPAVEREVCEARGRRESRRAEAALHESEQRFRSLVQNSLDVVLVIDAGAKVMYYSPSVEAVMGYKPEEFLNKNALEVVPIHPDDLSKVRDVFSYLAENPGANYSMEMRMRHADGSWRTVEATANNLLDDPSVGGLVINYRDITERKGTEESLRNSLGMLLALYEGNRILNSTLELQKIGARLLEIMCHVSGVTTAVISLRNAEHLYVWQSTGLENLWPKTRYAPEVRESLNAALENGTTQIFRPRPPDGRRIEEGDPTAGLCMPLRTREQTLGVLEAYGFEGLVEKGTVAVLESLTTHATSALENARLYGELAEREHRLEDLVGKLMTAQEEERRRVAYEVHDGLAQVATAAHQHLQAFARFHLPDSEESREILYRALELVQQTVGDARRIIANLRPTTLDDFGLQAAVRLEVEALRAEDWHITFEGTLKDDERLPFAVETALFRIVQEALTNIRKHANTKHVRLSLDRIEQGIRLSVWDWGVGFDPATLQTSSGPGERIGLSSMRERVALLGGDFQISSHPGAGTLITVDVPLSKQREADRERGDSG